MPALQLVENEREFLLTVELPGMRREDVELHVDNGVLTVSGEKKLEWEKERGRTHVHERECGAFARSYVLPKSVDAEAINADYHRGVVTIRLPKAAQAKGRHIEIG